MSLLQKLYYKSADVSLYCGDIIGTTIVYETTTTQQVTLEYSRFTFSFSINCLIILCKLLVDCFWSFCDLNVTPFYSIKSFIVLRIQQVHYVKDLAHDLISILILVIAFNII